MPSRIGLFALFTVCLSSPVLAQEQTSTVTGTVVDSANQPMSGVLVFVDEGPGSATTGAVGAFRLEGVTPGTHFLNFRKVGFAPRTFDLVFAPNEDRRDVGVVVLQAGPHPTATLSGSVTDGASGRPLGGAVVKLNGDVVALTDGDGVFLLSEVPIVWGSNEFEVGRFAFAARTSEFWIVDPNETLDFFATLDPIPIDVARVVANVAPTPSVSTRLQPFYDRLESSAGQFVTRSEIEAREPPVITDVLRGVSGLRLRPGPLGIEIHFRRQQIGFDRPGFDRATPGFRDEPGCPMPLIFLDGFFVGGGERYIDINDLVHPDEVEGIEIYSSAATIPIEFNRSGGACGVLVIWTR